MRPEKLPSGAQLTVYRLVQEALTNTMKHGGGNTHATVRLRYLPGELLVDIEDDGAGALARRARYRRPRVDRHARTRARLRW